MEYSDADSTKIAIREVYSSAYSSPIAVFSCLRAISRRITMAMVKSRLTAMESDQYGTAKLYAELAQMLFPGTAVWTQAITDSAI